MRYEDEPMDEDLRRYDSYPATTAALDRVRILAILLIIVGVLNIPGGMFLGADRRQRHLEFGEQ